MIITAACTLLLRDANATTVRGRAFFTYQNVKGTLSDAEYLTQNLETAIRDRLFEKNNLMLSLHFDNTRNLRRKLTTRRYYGRLELSGLYYNFSMHYSPKQKITPLEVELSREFTDKQFVLDLTIPSLPQLRFFYAKKRQFTEGEFTGLSRSMRADMRYSYKFMELALNRWHDQSENSTESKTTVTGGYIRMARSFYRTANINSGYEYILTESYRQPGTEKKVSNHTLTALASGRYKKYITGSLSVVSRWLNTGNDEASESRNNTVSFHMNIFPNYPVRLDLARNYLQSRQDTAKTISDYATVQLVLTGAFRKKTRGRAQIARRFVIKSSRGAIPANTYFFSVDSEIFRGLDARADLNVSRRDVKEFTKGKYQTNSRLEVYAKPRRNLQLSSSIQFFKYSHKFSLLKNDRASYNLTATYFPASRFHIGVDAQRSLITSGNVQTNDALTVNSSISWSNRSSFNISYGINTIETPQNADTTITESTGEIKEKIYRRTLNMQGQLWITKNGAISVNYSKQLLEDDKSTRFLTISYRQNY